MKKSFKLVIFCDKNPKLVTTFQSFSIFDYIISDIKRFEAKKTFQSHLFQTIPGNVEDTKCLRRQNKVAETIPAHIEVLKSSKLYRK